MRIVRTLFRAFVVSGAMLVITTLLNTGAAHASCGFTTPPSSSGSPGSITIVAKDNAGNPMNGINVTLSEVNGFYSIWHMPNASYDGHSFNSFTFTTGSGGCGSGVVQLGYGTSSVAGNGYVMGCHEYINPTGPSGGNNGKVAVWSLSGASAPGAGSWTYPGNFTMANGKNTVVTMTWNPAPVNITVSGYVHNSSGTGLSGVVIAMCNGSNPATDGAGNWSVVFPKGTGFCAVPNANPDTSKYNDPPSINGSYVPSGPLGSSCNNPGRYDCQSAGNTVQGMDGANNYNFTYNCKVVGCGAPLATISGRVYENTGPKTGIGNVTVSLPTWSAASGAGILSTITQPDGSWSINIDSSLDFGAYVGNTGSRTNINPNPARYVDTPGLNGAYQTGVVGCWNPGQYDCQHPNTLRQGMGGTNGYDFIFDLKPVSQGVQGRVFVDENGNGSYDSGEEVLRAPGTPGCSGGPSVAYDFTITGDGTNGNLNQCTGDPTIGSGSYGYYTIPTSAGSGKAVNLNLPAGWTATNGSTRSVTVNSGSYTDVGPWFGVIPSAPTYGPFTCSGGNPVTTLSWRDLRIAGGPTGYHADIADQAAPVGWYVSVGNGNGVTATTPLPNNASPWGSQTTNLSAFIPGHKYDVRIGYLVAGVHSQTVSFTVPNVCVPPAPPAPTFTISCSGFPSYVDIGNVDWGANPGGAATSYTVDLDNPGVGQFSGSHYHKTVSAPTVSTLTTSGFTQATTSAPFTNIIPLANYVARVYYAGGTYDTQRSLVATSTPVAAPPCAAPPLAGPYFTASSGDINASGGIGATCSSSGSVKNNSATSTASIITAINGITGFSATPPFLLTPYHPVCRPDIYARVVTAGQYYRVNYPAVYDVSIGGGLGSPVLFSSLPNTPVVWVHNDLVLDTVLGGIPAQRQTIVVDGRLIIRGKGIKRNTTTTVTAGTLSSLPTLGVVVKKDIYIEDTVKDLYGFYTAGTAGVPGTIHTCTSGVTPWDIYALPSAANKCNLALNIEGAMFASDYDFRRTGNGSFGNVPTEIVAASGDLYLAPPPGFADVFVLPHSEGEKSPKL